MQTSRVIRSAQLLSLPAGAAALSVEGVARRLAGQDREQVATELRRRNAARTQRVLGGLKGGALKAGQLLSTVEALFPQDPESTWRDTLVGLQEGNAPLPFVEVEPVLRAELGDTWRELFADFREEAVAAASIGQVHRATWTGGRPVAVKVQYPGVREALTADVRTLSAMSRAAALVARGLAMPPLIAELRDRLTEELDYLHEGRTQTQFATTYADDPDVRVPAVVRATPRVLVMDWIDGTPLAAVARNGTQAERDRAAGLYQRFLVSGPERAGLLHTDPHPGNFRILPDGRLGVLDFGSSLALPGGMPATFGRLIGALLGGDGEQVLRRLREEGFVRPGVQVDVAKLVDYMSPFTVPARHERFHFSREWLRGEFARVNDPRNPEFGVALKLDLPAEHLFTHRVWLGMVGVLCQLEATVEVRPVLQRWLPGFS
jgi:predicted unusual protein kinase regulating ubiquinone biosynthesis (AarF/ABC1/UbiB family)